MLESIFLQYVEDKQLINSTQKTKSVFDVIGSLFIVLVWTSAPASQTCMYLREEITGCCSFLWLHGRQLLRDFDVCRSRVRRWVAGQCHIHRSSHPEPGRCSQSLTLCSSAEAPDLPRYRAPGEGNISNAHLLFFGHVSPTESTKHSLTNIPETSNSQSIQSE